VPLSSRAETSTLEIPSLPWDQTLQHAVKREVQKSLKNEGYHH
jgi:hypothetical protein